MAGTATVTVTPGKRYADDDENLAVADFQQMDMPLLQLDAGSVGTAEFITADVAAMIGEQLRGLQVSYTFPIVYSLPYTGTALSFAKVTLPGVRQGDPVWCSQVTSLSVQFDAQVDATDQVNFRAIPAGPGVSIPAGTVITAVVFTSKRVTSRGDAGGPVTELATDTGYLDLTAGFSFAYPLPGSMSQGITTTELDAIASGLTATVRPASIGRREIDPASLNKLSAATVGGLPFKFRYLSPLTVLASNVSAPRTLTLTGALTTQVPVCGNRVGIGFDPLRFEAYVSAADTITIYARNMTNVQQTIAKGATVQGRLL